MKKTAFIITAFIILFVLSAQVCMAEDVYKDTLRVGLSYGASAKETATFYSNDDIAVYDVNTGGGIAYISAGTPITLTATGGIVASDQFYYYTDVVRLESIGTIFYNHKEYRGAFEVRNNGDLFRVINIVDTDDYLASLLGREMSVTWPLEALKAQAVCARNYAFTIGGKHSSYGFDICAEQHCQVYGGVSSEAESTRRAVEETEGILVTYKDKVVPLYYFSCDGGYTEDSENVWVSAEGYLRGKKDIYENPEYATLYNWTKTFTKEEIENILLSRGVEIGELKDVVIEEVSDNKGVIKLTFYGDMGEKSITKSSVRSYLSLNSNAFTIEKHALGEEVEEEIELPPVYVLSGSGMVEVSEPGYIMTSEGLYEIPYEEEAPVDEDVSYVAYTFHGHGWGHLVGMSQWGAYSMAMLGLNYRDILSFYFTDIEFVDNKPDVAEEFVTDDEEVIEEWVECEEETEAESDGAVTDDNIQWSDTGI